MERAGQYCTGGDREVMGSGDRERQVMDGCYGVGMGLRFQTGARWVYWPGNTSAEKKKSM